jgi:hypothetical protein
VPLLDPPALSLTVTVWPGGAWAKLGAQLFPGVVAQICVLPLNTEYGPVPPLQLMLVTVPLTFAPVIVNGDPAVPPVKFSVVVSEALYSTLSVTVAVIV